MSDWFILFRFHHNYPDAGNDRYKKAPLPRGRYKCFQGALARPICQFEMVVTASSGQHALSQRRAQLAGPSGVKGLLSNLRIFAIAVFASLGGFVYGCEHFYLTILPAILVLIEERR